MSCEEFHTYIYGSPALLKKLDALRNMVIPLIDTKLPKLSFFIVVIILPLYAKTSCSAPMTPSSPEIRKLSNFSFCTELAQGQSCLQLLGVSI